MDAEAQEAIKQVLREASDHDAFAGMSFAERLNWMIGRGYALGRCDRENRESCRRQRMLKTTTKGGAARC